MNSPFLFSTGIENSYPVLPNGRRVDQMEKCGHYARWQEDFALVRDMGVAALRYGPAYYKTHVAPDGSTGAVPTSRFIRCAIRGSS